MTNLVKIGDVSNYRKEFFKITDSEEYKRCRVQLHKKGVVLRDIVKGNDIKTKQQRLCKKNDFIVAEMDAKFGGYGIIPETLDDAIVSSHYYLFELKEEKILPEFLKVLIDTDIIQLQIKAKGSTNYSRISPKEVMEFEIPCPSIEFQQQVVKKYSNSKIDIIKLLNEANYQLNLLKQLRQAMLQESVEGKLTAEWRKQNPELISGENHAARLLEKIKAEKERLVKEGKINKQKALPPISEDEKPFELPEGWVWCRLGELGIINPRNYINDNLEVSFIPMTKISEKYGINPTFDIKPWHVIKNGFTHFAENDIGLAKITPCFENSKACVFVKLINAFGAGTTELHILRLITNDLLSFYVYIFFKSPNFLLKGEKLMTGTAGQKRVPVTYFQNAVFAFPPLPEQKAIVEKVDRLMANIDALEAQVKSCKEHAAQLMQAVLREAFNGA